MKTPPLRHDIHNIMAFFFLVIMILVSIGALLHVGPYSVCELGQLPGACRPVMALRSNRQAGFLPLVCCVNKLTHPT